MINILANKLPSVTDEKNLIWKNSDINLYNKFNQTNMSSINGIIKDVVLSEVSAAIKEKISVKAILPSLTEEKNLNLVTIENEVINASNRLSTELKNIPKVLKVIPVTNITNTTDKTNTTNTTNTNNVKITISCPKVLRVKELSDVSKKNTKKPNPINIILEESATCDIYKNDVKEKLISFVSSNEFSKVFGITKSAEIMSGIVNERVNKSVALFISFLFDKRVLYNEKEITYDKNKEYIGIINV
jgi:hypothetical protein